MPVTPQAQTERLERRLGDRRLSQRRSSDLRRLSASPARWGTSAEIVGFLIEATDGVFGRVADLRAEEEGVVVTQIVVRALHGMSGRWRLLVPVSAVERVDWAQRKLYLRQTRAELRQWSSPARSPVRL